MKNYLWFVFLIVISIQVAQAQPDSLHKTLLMPICTSICTGILGENIFPNGDFGSGIPNILPTNPFLAPGFIYQLNPPPNDGFYCITNNTSPWGSFAANFWINIEDNGPEPNGYMMVVNANYQPGLFYQKTVDVCENTVYELSIDIISLIKMGVPNFILPNISFLIDGNVVCETGNIPQDEQWRTVRFSFLSQANQTTATFALRNNAPGGGGNDLAIDNISLRACGPGIELPATIPFCPGIPLTIPSLLTNAPYNNPVYLWQTFTNGIWQDIPNSNNDSLEILSPTDGSQFRLVVASAFANLALPNCRVVSQPVQLILRPNPVVSTLAQDVSCAGVANAMVSAQVSAGTAPFVYAWDSGDSTSNLNGLSPGAYSVTVTDALGCTGVASVSITEPPLLSLSASHTNISCFGNQDGHAALSVAGGVLPYNYVWTNGQTNSSIVQLMAGTYLVTITDANACKRIDSVVITEPALLSSSTSATDISCFGKQDGHVSISAFGGMSPFAYAWSNGQTSNAIADLGPGSYQVTITDITGCTALASVAVSEPALLTTDATVTNVSCFGMNDATAAVTVAGGVLPYSYSWSNGQTDNPLSNLLAGIYMVTVSDANACTETALVEATEPLLLAVSTSVSNVSCFASNDAQATVTGAGGVSPFGYVWSNGQTSATCNNLSPGIYEVTLTDGLGCTGIASVTITEPPLLAATAMASEVSCFGGEDAAAAVSAAGGVLPYTYIWSNGQTGAGMTNLAAGIFWVTVTDLNACKTITSVTVTEPPALATSVVSTNVLCFGDAHGTALASVTGGVAPYTYSWSNGQTNAAAINLVAGVYAYSVTDVKGCLATGAANINEPPLFSISAQAVDVTCHGSVNGLASTTASGGVEPYTFLWSNGQTGVLNKNLPPGTYQLTATDAQGCTQISQLEIVQPSAFSNSIGVEHVACNGEATGGIAVVVAGGTLPYQFHWNTGANTPQITNLPMGNYVLSITDGNGCVLNISAQVNQPPPLVLQTNKKNIKCFGDKDGALNALASGGVMPYALQWSSGQTTLDINGLSEGTYTLSVTDAHGCKISTSQFVAEPNLQTVELGLDVTINLGDVIDLQAIVNIPDSEVMDYTWSGSEGFLQCADCNTFSFQPIAPGCQQVLVRSKKGCIALDTFCYLISRHRRIYPPNVFSPNGDGVNDFFTIFSDDGVKQILSLKIFNRWGGQIYEAHNIKTNDEPSGWNGSFKGQDLNMDVFVWVALIEFIDGEVIQLSGDVTLVR